MEIHIRDLENDSTQLLPKLSPCFGWVWCTLLAPFHVLDLHSTPFLAKSSTCLQPKKKHFHFLSQELVMKPKLRLWPTNKAWVQSEPTPNSAPWRMNDKWSGKNFLLGFSFLANHGGLAQLVFLFLFSYLPTN
jgi:hypothetical protein